MAVDTRLRRRSALSFGQVYMVGSTPTGTIGAEPRKDVTFSYSGISSGAPVAFVPKPSGMLAAQNVRRTMRRYRGGRR